MSAPESSVLARRWWDKLDLYAVALALIGLVYVALQWSPSSYGYALRLLGVEEWRPLLGRPRGIRSDEWAVWTPYLQAAVNNGFERWNATSVYVEDLRNFNALPLWDWALIFKPYFWPFFFAAPATAFSFYHFSVMAAFLLGYRMLFARLGLSSGLAAFFATLLFFTGYVQHWWTTIGPTIGFYPWLLLALAMRADGGWRLALKGLLVGYVGALWLLSHLYPPLIISLAFIGAPLLWALRPDLIRRPRELATLAGAVLIGCALAAWYLRDPILAMLDTVYPGGRVSDGGGVSWRILIGQIFPTFNQAGISPVGVENLCEGSSIGAWTLLALVFFSRRDPQTPLPWGRLALVGLTAAAPVAWMITPMPAIVGKILLWRQIPPPRMLFAAGLLLFFATALLAQARLWAITPRRVALFAVPVVAAWAASKLILDQEPLWKGLLDLAILVPLALAAMVPWLRTHLSARTAVLGSVMIANLAAFGFFNPIQPAGPIFAVQDTPKLAALKAKAAAHPAGWLTEGGYPGAILNGLGFAAVAHVAVTPQTGFYRLHYPELPQAEFDHLFKRYHHLRLERVDPPLLPQPDLVIGDGARFDGPPRGRPASLNPTRQAATGAGGALERRERDGTLVLRGWAPWRGLKATQTLEIHTDAPVELVSVATARRARWDGSVAPSDQRLSGFILTLRPTGPLPQPLDLCVVAASPETGRMLLSDPAQRPGACAALLESRP